MGPKRKILLTGFDGFIGSKLCREIEKTDLYDLTLASLQLENFESIKTCIESQVWDIVIHLAGISYAPICEDNPELAYRINTEATQYLAERLSKSSPNAHLIFPSTSYVYAPVDENQDVICIDESFPVQPINIYAKTKLQAEVSLAKISKDENLKITILRLFNHTHHSQSKNFFLPNMYQQLIDQKKSSGLILKVGNLNLNRDFGSIFDLVSILMKVVESSDQFPQFGKYNLCSGTGKNLKVMLELLAKKLNITELKLEVDSKRLRKKEPKTIVGDNHLLSSILHFYPTCKTEEDLIDHFLRDV